MSYFRCYLCDTELEYWTDLARGQSPCDLSCQERYNRYGIQRALTDDGSHFEILHLVCPSKHLCRWTSEIHWRLEQPQNSRYSNTFKALISIKFRVSFSLQISSGSCSGIPNVREQTCNEITNIPVSEIPSTTDAVASYESDGGILSRQSEFGMDPFADWLDLIQRRDSLFKATNLPYDVIFGQVSCGHHGFLQKAVMDFINATYSLL
jgi:hypothetical protein